MIGILQGTLIAFPHQSRTGKRFLWRDGLIGLLFAVVFFSIDEYAVFHISINQVNYEIPDFLFYVLMGVAGAGFGADTARVLISPFQMYQKKRRHFSMLIG